MQNTVKIFVCDEADEMVAEKDSHGKETKKIKSKLSESVQTLLFSATFPTEVVDYSRQLVSKPFIVTLASNEQMVLSNIYQLRMNMQRVPGFDQPVVGMAVDVSDRERRGIQSGVVNAVKPGGFYDITLDDGSRISADLRSIRTTTARKLAVLKAIYSQLTIDQSIVFCMTRVQAEQVAQLLHNDSYTVSFMHGELAPLERDRAIELFKQGLTKVLVTTNVLAKGLDVPAVDLVINFNLPLKFGKADVLTYLHRIGRCARFGRPGSAISLLDDSQDEAKMMDIERHYNFSADKRMTEEWDQNDMSTLAVAVRERAEDNAADAVELVQTPVIADEGDSGTSSAAGSSTARGSTARGGRK